MPRGAAEIAHRKVPEWLSAHFRESIESHELLMGIVHISQRGISVIRSMPQAVKALANLNGNVEEPESQQKLERAEKEATLAATEVEHDFPVLHGLATVALWSWLEHLVKGLVTLWLLNHPEALSTPAVQKLRVRLGDYLQLERAEQAAFLVDLLEQDIASPLKRGANRFTTLLEPFGLGFSVPESCGRQLFELQQIRNAVAHRNGRADRKLQTECPWLDLQVGERVQISGRMLHAYSGGASEFLLNLLYRIGDVHQLDVRPKDEERT